MSDTLFENILYDLIVTFISATVAFLFGRYVIGWWKRRRYGGWFIMVLDEDGNEVTRRKLSPELVETIRSDDHHMAVVVKGVASTHENWLKADPVASEMRGTLLTIDEKQRLITLDYRHNVPPKRASSLPSAPSESEA